MLYFFCLIYSRGSECGIALAFATDKGAALALRAPQEGYHRTPRYAWACSGAQTPQGVERCSTFSGDGSAYSTTERIMVSNPNQTKEAERAKKVILQCIADGMTVEQSCKVAGKSIKTYEYYRRSDAVFKQLADRTRLGSLEKNFAEETAKDLDFVTWRKKYLKQETFPHQKNLIDTIEGRQPEWLHPAMKYEKGIASNRILLNIPPNHAKSITVTVDYVTYKIVNNPNFRVLIVSQTQRLAADFLYAIKQRLTHPMYEELQQAYAAGVGFNTKTAS